MSLILDDKQKNRRISFVIMVSVQHDVGVCVCVNQTSMHQGKYCDHILADVL